VELHYSVWLSVIPTVFALLALAYAYHSSRLARAALAASDPAPAPIAPQRTAPLSVTVLDGRAHRDLGTDAREYAFLTAIEHASGGETTIVDIELRVSYRTRANFCGAVDVPISVDADTRLTSSQPRLHVPLRLGPGQTASGWIEFHTANIIPRHCRVDGYTILVTEASGARLSIDASLSAVLRADTDGRGPATWGWD